MPRRPFPAMDKRLEAVRNWFEDEARSNRTLEGAASRLPNADEQCGDLGDDSEDDL